MKFTSYASGSTGNLYTLDDGITSLIIEAGVSYRDMQRLLPFPPSNYDACLISHRHKDHSECAQTLASRGVWIGCPEDTAEKIGLPSSSILTAGIQTSISTLEVKPFNVRHDDDCPCFGYIIKSRRDGESCVFMVDGSYTDKRFGFSPTLFCLEANFAADLLKPGESLNDRLFFTHMEISQAIATLQANDLSKTREIWLLHLSDSRSDEDRFIREVQAATGVPTFAAPAFKPQGR